MPETTKPNSTAADVAALVERLFQPTIKTFDDHRGHERPVLVLPTGLEANSVKALMDEYRTRPERPKGTAKFFDLASFIAWVNRQKLAPSVIFANNNMQSPSVTAVINYHDPNADHEEYDSGWHAGYGDHRGTYAFPLSKTWNAWVQAEAKGYMG